uniref:DNA-directed RNA polymerase subunit beta n=1 Tax=Nitella hyalina TaxID=181804 RepID=A0A2H4G3H0_NITHY|nr:RNA polymerase beta subunit [Nitella hyalina]APP89490.1 RNA polymerase beta subunit [Nitella hyalina]WKT08414.1 RNA polymerase beta subunit [Nitella hyalina]
MNKFDKNTDIFILPDFIRIQLKSFHRFVQKGLLEEFQKFPVIQDSTGELKYFIYGKKYRLQEPNLNENEAIYQASTYSSELYVPAEITNTSSGKSQSEIILLGNIPIMTTRGAFIINGAYRVIVNQILRSPGIYYGSELDAQANLIYTCTIISEWGGRLKLEMDNKKRIWIRLNKKRKVPVLLLLLAMGLTWKDLKKHISRPSILLSYLSKEKETPYSSEEAMIELYRHSCSISGEISFSENIRRELYHKFFRIRCEIGNIGRLNINKKLKLDIPEEERFLLPQDIVAAINYLIEIRFQVGNLDDIDHLKNRRVHLVAEMLQSQVKIALHRLKRMIAEVMRGVNKRKNLPNPQGLVNPKPLVATFQEFFGSHPLCQFMDQTNPLAEITHKRRISSLGPGGLTQKTATFNVRDIHPSHYGKICPIETPEGPNAGLVASLATLANINKNGSIESPFLKLKKSEHRYNNLLTGSRYLCSEEEENYRIATGEHSRQSSEKNNKLTPVRYKQEFITTVFNNIHFRDISPIQYFSIATSLIPFLEHDDANRALMGSNMQRQAVPLLKPEKPIVGTGLEAQVALDSGVLVISKTTGKVNFVDGKNIKIQISNTLEKFFHLEFITYERSNQNTCIHQKTLVQKDDLIKKGQLLADGSSTLGGEISLGKNILVAYMPWEGYNFEDAVLINERLIYEDIYTSIHIEKYEIEAHITNLGPEKITKKIPHLNENLLRNLDINGLIKLGSLTKTGDVLVGKLTPREPGESLRLPEGRLLHAIFGVKASSFYETCLKVVAGGEGRVIDVRWIEHEDKVTKKHIRTVNVYILQKRKIQVGDKVAGRHGNKGVVSRILSREDMPYLQDGTPIDMILSPLGVPSRMNLGQIFECLLGLAGNSLNKHYRIMPFDERHEREASRKLVFSELFQAKNFTGHNWLFEPDTPGKSKLFDGRTGEAFENSITVGKAYILKLIHQVDDKIHARSTGPYSMVTQQPLGGKARRGGQRMGEMEVWALEGFGAAYTLQELLTIKSDDMKGRNETLGAIITGNSIPEPNTTPESFKLLMRELRCLCLSIEHCSLFQENLHVNSMEF